MLFLLPILRAADWFAAPVSLGTLCSSAAAASIAPVALHWPHSGRESNSADCSYGDLETRQGESTQNNRVRDK